MARSRIRRLRVSVAATSGPRSTRLAVSDAWDRLQAATLTRRTASRTATWGTRRAPPGVGLARRSVTIEVTVSGPVWVPEAQSQGPVHPDMGEPDERHRHGQARAAEHTTKSQDSGWKVGVGQVVGDRTSPGADHVSEKTQVRNREQCDEQPPRLPLPAVQDRRHGEQGDPFASEQHARQAGHHARAVLAGVDGRGHCSSPTRGPRSCPTPSRRLRPGGNRAAMPAPGTRGRAPGPRSAWAWACPRSTARWRRRPRAR
jgi:hypothetical protein